MPRKQKLSIEEKVELVRQCINGKISISGAAQQAGVAPKSVRRWIIAYESEGAEAFLPHDQNRVYSPELKTKAVQEYDLLCLFLYIRESCDRIELSQNQKLKLLNPFGFMLG